MRNKKGQFEKGFGGRPQGSKNKATIDIKTKIGELVSDNFERLEEDLETLSPSERVKAYLKLLEFVVPKQRHIEQKLDLSNLSESEINSLYDRATKLVFENKTDEDLDNEIKRLNDKRDNG